MKIAFVFDGLSIGGIERVGLDYIKLLSEEGHIIDVYNVNSQYYAFKQELPKSVNYYNKRFPATLCPDIYSYGIKKWWWGKYVYPLIYAPLKALLYIRKIFRPKKQYDLSIAFSGHFRDLTYVAYNFIRARKKACWLHGSLADYMIIADGYVELYKKVNNLVVLSQLMQQSVLQYNKFLKCLNIKKIYNPSLIMSRPIDEDKVKLLKKEHGSFVLCVARFSTQKDHWTIINAIKILNEKYKIKNKFIFLGEGETKSTIEEYALQAGVSSLCVFEGNKNDVQNYYSAAIAFVHSSPSEGLPTTLIESMALGLPIVATDSQPGVGELLQNKYGIVVPVGNANELAKGLNQILSDEELRRKYICLGLERFAAFTPKYVKEEFSNFLLES